MVNREIINWAFGMKEIVGEAYLLSRHGSRD